MSVTEIVVTISVAVIGSGLINTILSYIVSRQKERRERNDEVRQACRLIMKDRLRFLCIHYIKQNWIYEDELEDLIAMHDCYHTTLNGNGFLDTQMEKVKSLEVRGIGVK